MGLKPEDDERMVRYLLDDLTPQEREESEQRYFFDDAYFESLRAVECELIRDYFCNDLSAALRRKFEAKYLQSDGLRRKLDLARELARRAPASPEPPVRGMGTPPGLFVRLGRLFRPGSGSFNLALSGGFVALLAGTVWLGVLVSQLREAVARLGSSGSGVVASFVLSPGGALRGARAADRFVIQPGTVSIRLQLDLEHNRPANAYRAFVTSEGDLVWSGDALVTNRGSAVMIEIPAALLVSGGNYIIDLKTLGDSGALAPTESYSFGVLRR